MPTLSSLLYTCLNPLTKTILLIRSELAVKNTTGNMVPVFHHCSASIGQYAMALSIGGEFRLVSFSVLIIITDMWWW